jgi:hypothetical protein
MDRHSPHRPLHAWAVYIACGAAWHNAACSSLGMRYFLLFWICIVFGCGNHFLCLQNDMQPFSFIHYKCIRANWLVNECWIDQNLALWLNPSSCWIVRDYWWLLLCLSWLENTKRFHFHRNKACWITGDWLRASVRSWETRLGLLGLILGLLGLSIRVIPITLIRHGAPQVHLEQDRHAIALLCCCACWK